METTLENESRLLREVATLRRERSVLSRQLHEAREETHTMVRHYQDQADERGMEIRSLRRELAERDASGERRAKVAMSDLEQEIQDVRDSSKLSERALRKKLRRTEKRLEEARRIEEERRGGGGDASEERVVELNQAMAAMSREMEKERTKHQKEELRMKRSMAAECQEIRRNAAEVARADIDALMGEIMTDNRGITEELRKQLVLITDLAAENENSKRLLDELRRELDMHRDNAREHARLSRAQSVENRQLEAKVALLTDEMAKMCHAYKENVACLKARHEQAVRDAIEGSAKLKGALADKIAELSRAKNAATRVIRERGEVEEFLLDTLAVVKETIAAEKFRKKAEQVPQDSWHGATNFPPISSGNEGARGNSYNESAERVELSELTWSDRERVLQILLSKLNEGKGRSLKTPQHSLEAV